MAGQQRPDRIGIILVHGIGEQRRFQHLDEQLRDIIRALEADPGVEQVSVNIAAPGAAPFHAEHDTWTTGPEPSVTISLRHGLAGQPRDALLLVHEVWWADVNEPYSLAKQVRFWIWGLAVWAHPGKRDSGFATSAQVVPPRTAHGLWDRLRLFLVGVVFALVGFSIGALTFLANRLFDLQTPDLLRTLANYVSAVKLYNQPSRLGPGPFPASEDFLDAIGEPPRVSVRRRMIRAIADVACNCYDRWYILAHSQGAVVAFNGLMETAYAWPAYLDERRWQRCRHQGFVGPGTIGLPGAGRQNETMPRRPIWLGATNIAYRRLIFGRLRGFLTYGSPLEKFAGIWPALVPIGREPAFAADLPWINLFDPIDPVSGELHAFTGQPPECCPRPIDYGYAAYWVLLIAHLKYLTPRNPQTDAVTATARWLLTDNTAGFRHEDTGWKLATWFLPASMQRKVRSVIAWTTWTAAAAVLAMLSAIILPMLLEAAGAALVAIGHGIVQLAPWLAILAPVFVWWDVMVDWFVRIGADFWSRVLLLLITAVVITLLAGLFGRLWAYLFHKPDPRERSPIEPVPAPGDPDFRLPSATPEDLDDPCGPASPVPG